MDRRDDLPGISLTCDTEPPRLLSSRPDFWHRQMLGSQLAAQHLNESAGFDDGEQRRRQGGKIEITGGSFDRVCVEVNGDCFAVLNRFDGRHADNWHDTTIHEIAKVNTRKRSGNNRSDTAVF